jgi:hypothetical protein
VRIRTLTKGDRGPEVTWLKSWLNFLVTPAPNLKADNKFDDDTAQAVLSFKIQNNLIPIDGVADTHVYTAIWQKIAPSLSNTTIFGSQLRFDRTLFLDHFLQSFSEVKEETVPNLLDFLGKIEWDDGFKSEHVPWVAYVLATTWWETARTFAPVPEGGCNDVTGCTAITNPKTGAVNRRTYGAPTPCPNTEAGTPCPAHPTDTPDPRTGRLPRVTHTYYGRGYVQLTFRDNYRAASQWLFRQGLLPAEDHLIHFPEKVMDEDIAYLIISVGLREGRFFTRQSLSDYIDVAHPATAAARLTQYKNARHLVNGTDHNDDIAAIAVKFEKILNLSRVDAPHWNTLPPPAGLTLGGSGPAAPNPITPFTPSPLPVGPF